jgi:hypothetical protein
VPEVRLPRVSGTGEPYTAQQPRIANRCQSCGARSLFIGAGGWLTCSVIGCARPAHEEAVEALRAERDEALARCGQLREALKHARLTLSQSESTEPEDDISEDEVGRCWQHRCDDGVGGCTAVSEDARINALRSIVAALAATADAGAWLDAEREKVRAEEREACAVLALGAHGAGANTKPQQVIAAAIRDRARSEQPTPEQGDA